MFSVFLVRIVHNRPREGIVYMPPDTNYGHNSICLDNSLAVDFTQSFNEAMPSLKAATESALQ